MKLIIDIDETTYDLLKQIYNPEIGMLSPTYEAVVNGIPLDDIKKEIDKKSDMHMDGEFYIRNLDVKCILDRNKENLTICSDDRGVNKKIEAPTII